MSKTATALAEVSNDGAFAVESAIPYIVDVQVEGAAAFLFHRWSVDGVEAKSKLQRAVRPRRKMIWNPMSTATKKDYFVFLLSISACLSSTPRSTSKTPALRVSLQWICSKLESLA